VHVLHALMRNSCTAWEAAGTLSGHSRSLAQGALETQQCPALQIEPRGAGSVMQTDNRLRSHVDLGQSPALRGFEGNPTLHSKGGRFRSWLSAHRHAQRQATWRQHGGIMELSCRHQMFQTYEQTNPPLPLFWCARAEVRLALRPHV